MADTIPALRGHLGDWEYYLTVMKLGKLAKEVDLAAKLHPHKELDRIIQREISSRVGPMVDYLLNQKERFYGALIVAVYGGQPKFHPVKMAEHPLLDDEFPFGVVMFDGSQRYFALDGQHRLESIRLALEQNPALGEEEISVIMVPHHRTPDGLRRTRRLFSTINRYAKPTSTAVNISMDEDDAFAIVTRRLIREHVMFNAEGRIKIKGASIPDRNQEAFTTLSILYQMNEILLTSKERELRFGSKKFKQFRPAEDELEGWYEELEGIWNTIIDGFSEFRDIAEDRQLPQYYRKTAPESNREDGHLLFRPIGQLAFARALRLLMNEGMTLEDAVGRGAQVDWRLGQTPWRWVVWHPGEQKMITTKEAQNFAAQLAAYLMGSTKEDPVELTQRYARAADDPRAKLPPRTQA